MLKRTFINSKVSYIKTFSKFNCNVFNS